MRSLLANPFVVRKSCPAVSHLKVRGIKLILITVDVANCQVVQSGTKYLQPSEGHLLDCAVPNPVGDAVVPSILSLNHF